MRKFLYRDPENINTEEEYIRYVKSETRERNIRHREALQLLGIDVDKRISQSDSTVVEYYYKGEKIALINNCVPFSKEEKQYKSDLIPCGNLIDIKDGRTVSIEDDFEFLDENEQYSFFTTKISIYSTAAILKGDFKPIVECSYLTNSEGKNSALAIYTDTTYILASNSALTFRVAEGRRKRELDFGGKTACYCEAIIGEGNDEAKGQVEVKKVEDDYYFVAGHGDFPPSKKIDEFTAIRYSKQIVANERVRELVDNSIQFVDLKLGNNNGLRKRLLNKYPRMKSLIESTISQNEIEPLIDGIKISALNFGKNGSVFEEPTPERKNLE